MPRTLKAAQIRDPAAWHNSDASDRTNELVPILRVENAEKAAQWYARLGFCWTAFTASNQVSRPTPLCAAKRRTSICRNIARTLLVGASCTGTSIEGRWRRVQRSSVSPSNASRSMTPVQVLGSVVTVGAIAYGA